MKERIDEIIEYFKDPEMDFKTFSLHTAKKFGEIRKELVKLSDQRMKNNALITHEETTLHSEYGEILMLLKLKGKKNGINRNEKQPES